MVIRVVGATAHQFLRLLVRLHKFSAFRTM
jgi:hypothetical protein